MKLSIIIPCYNVEQYIETCFKSIDNQLKQDYEAIFINDGATDNTGSVIERLRENSNKKDQIKIIHQQNTGLSGARNTGINLAKGAYISFVDGDDWVAEHYFDVLLETIQDNDLAVASYNRVYAHNFEPRVFGKAGKFSQQQWKRRLLGLYGEELKDPSQTDSMVTAWGKLYKTYIIQKNKLQFVDTQLIGTEDLLFNLEYAQLIQNVIILDQPLYNYRKDNDTSLTRKYKLDLISKWQRKYEYILERITINTYEEKQAFQNRIALSIIGLGINEMSNPKGRKEIIKNFKFLLQKQQYRVALEQLELNYFPIHWRLFFKSAKQNNATLLYWLLKCLTYLLDRKNK